MIIILLWLPEWLHDPNNSLGYQVMTSTLIWTVRWGPVGAKNPKLAEATKVWSLTYHMDSHGNFVSTKNSDWVGVKWWNFNAQPFQILDTVSCLSHVSWRIALRYPCGSRVPSPSAQPSFLCTLKPWDRPVSSEVGRRALPWLGWMLAA